MCEVGFSGFHPQSVKSKISFCREHGTPMPVTFSYFFQIGILLLFGCRGSFVVPHTGYYEDGKVKEHGTFRDGEKHGSWTEYENDGTIVAQGTYRYGKEWDGSFISYEVLAERGEFRVIRAYHQGKRHGSYTWYFPNGTVMVSGNYERDQRSGSYVDYNADGKIQQQGYFTNNERDSLWVLFVEDGTKQIEAHYKRGRLDGAFTSYAKNGSRKYTGWSDAVQRTLVKNITI